MAYLKNPYLSAKNKNHRFLMVSDFTIIDYVEFRNTLQRDSIN